MTPYLLNGTCLTAVILANSDRHLFFQDDSGSIRRVVYAALSNQWAVDSNPITHSDARYRTPMAASVVKQPSGSEEVVSRIPKHTQAIFGSD